MSEKRAFTPPESRVEHAAIPKGNNAEIRIASQSYQGREVIDVRVWYARDGAEMRPSGRGLTFTPERAEAVAEAIIAAARSLSEPSAERLRERAA